MHRWTLHWNLLLEHVSKYIGKFTLYKCSNCRKFILDKLCILCYFWWVILLNLKFGAKSIQNYPKWWISSNWMTKLAVDLTCEIWLYHSIKKYLLKYVLLVKPQNWNWAYFTLDCCMTKVLNTLSRFYLVAQ